jgi:hypothetical protein
MDSSGQRFGGDLGCWSAAVRLRGMRGATRTPLYRDYCAKRLDAPPRMPLLARAARGRAQIVYSPSKSTSWKEKFGVARGFLYNFPPQEYLSQSGFSHE